MALATMTRRNAQSGQVLVFIALALPAVLLPVAAFAVDAAAAASVHARLEQATANAAESAVQQVDAATLRSGGGLVLDEGAVESAAREVLAAEDAGASLENVTVAGLYVTVNTSESLVLPLNFLGSPSVTVHASATARLAPGYESPSSFLPLSVSTF